MTTSVVLHANARYMLDTNVISETRKPRPNKRVMRFIAALGRPLLYVSVLTLGELERGVLQLKERQPSEAARIAQWLEELEILFRGRILPVDLQVGRTWGAFSSDRSRPVADTLLAATAYAHGLVLATRNTRHVQGLPISVLNPWEVELEAKLL